MNRFILSILLTFTTLISIEGKNFLIEGQVLDEKNTPIEYAYVILSGDGLWAITNQQGNFSIKNVPQGKTVLTVRCLGYAEKKQELNVQGNTSQLILTLQESNLALDEVVITAQRKTEGATTSYLIDRAALDHTQVMNITDISSLLPGGKSKEMNLASSQDERFSLRSGKSEKGNATFGTAIEIDGVRLNNNSSLDETQGASTRNISTTNIESIEVITGIPSVEYGDLSNGIVKVNTKKGETPYTADFSTQPHSKQFALSKGFKLGKNGGTLNTSLEHTNANSDLASPHTTYQRNGASLTYSKVLNKKMDKPITLTVGLSGNVGGFNDKKDPDAFEESYKKRKENTFRGNVKLNWLIDKSWITNLELFSSFSYSNKEYKVNKKNDSNTSQALIRGKEEGYFLTEEYFKNPNAPIIQGPTGNWYELSYTDNKPMDYNLKVKADWIRKFSTINSRLLIGLDFRNSGNKGKGLYYEDLSKAPTWREYKYSDLPFMNNLALFAEEKLTIPINQSALELTAGLRSDMTFINQSEYGTVQSLSPRFNAKYVLWKNKKGAIKDLSLYGGWGKAVKLPSFEVLYPSPSNSKFYTDVISFAHNIKDENSIYGYYIKPQNTIYNPDLKWQYSKQTEVGVEANILGAKISVSAFWNKTVNPYTSINLYTPYTYKLTNPIDDSFIIPQENRVFSMNQQTGIVTVSDQTGVLANQELSYLNRDTYQSDIMYTNGSPITRSGIEWVIDLPQIPALRTSFRIDGNYYHYKGLDERTIAWKPSSDVRMSDGSPYRFVGYYTGSSQNSTSGVNANSATGYSRNPSNATVANGKLSKQVNSNFTVTTHIPKIRLILSLTVEASFYNYSRNLSEYQGETRGFVLHSEDNVGWDTSNTNIYAGNQSVAVHPLYYSTWEEPNVQIPFTEALLQAKDKDATLYNDLSKLIIKTSNKTDFNPNKISAYFSANFKVTKEIGKFASLSFYANNFLNSMRKVKSSKEDTELSLYHSQFIPKFYYGLSLRIKL